MSADDLLATGPWLVEPLNGGGTYRITSAVDGHLETVLETRSNGQADAANAIVAAAALDLLAACEALILYDERPDDGPNAGIQMMVDYDHALTLARAAVGKARGGA